MEKNGSILICDSDQEFLSQLQNDLQSEGIAVEILNDATQLVSKASNIKPVVIVVNPDVNGFNEYDVCKKIIGEMGTNIVLMIDKNSTTRNSIGDCTAKDVITKPFDVKNLAFLISKHVAINQ